MFSLNRAHVRCCLENKYLSHFVTNEKDNSETVFSHFTSHFSPSKQYAFTLSEVLITLGIIGIVAAMTLPSLIKKHEERVTVTKVKAAYSLISQAYFRAMEEYGEDISSWDCFNVTTGYVKPVCLMDSLSKHLNVISSVNDRSDSVLYSLNMQKITSRYTQMNSLVLSNGFILKFPSSSTQSCETFRTWDVPEVEKFACELIVDINGHKGPNAFGRDTFVFKLHKDRVAPYGNYTQPYYQIWNSCNKEPLNEFYDGGINGKACAGWVITNENMDYLHCTGLSYNGKTKCK